ncbi:thiol reductant ABC exporter subunit CydC [Actinomyces gaoshouyii]|uniref:thiol reductant ABC exporter subunit CydC n=1 Tax=Actinomyces gaoshouyii TaxID=1960083 RepID=UPI0009C11DF4|nr:thiol reductant ABC exporter subunit CydC [Actinomyces gaoshouyii]ARD41505.1 thiol reductant ABC exporter subunit CydC [Actinomyces gaoshouyii]
MSPLPSLLAPDERRALRRAVDLLGLDRRRFAMSVIAGALSLGSAVSLTAVSAWLIARAAQMPDIAALGVAPVAVRLFGISRSVLRYCERLVSHSTALRGMSSLRSRLYETLASSRTDTVAGLRRGDVLARVGADIDAVGDLVIRAYLPVAIAIAVSTGTVAGIMIIHWPAGLILAVCLALSGIVGPAITIRSARAAELARQEQATDLTAHALTAIESGSELSVSGRMPRLMEEVATAEKRLAASRDAGARPAAVAAALDTAALGLTVIGALLTGIPAVSSGRLAPVMLAVIVLVPLSAFEAVAALGPASVQLVRSAGAARRVVGLVEAAEASAARVPKPSLLPEVAEGGPRLRARGLAVGWPGGPIVASGIDLDLAPGRRLAIIGPSGIGKTTLLLTLAGLIEPKAGEITIDGASPWGAERRDVAGRLTLTAEDAHVFDTSVLENLRVADGALTPERATALLERAGLAAWLDALPAGLDTPLDTGATGISGGERRRLLLARALAAPAPLLLIDEPGEHLDAATADRLVADLLDAGSRARGILLITHRLSALADADEILVLGRSGESARGSGEPATVLASGTHDELMRNSETYRWSLSQENADA